MIRKLQKKSTGCYYYVDGKRVEGVHGRIWGDVSNIRGNLDDCGITEKEREQGISITDLLSEKEEE